MGDTQQQAPTGAGSKKPLSDLTKVELIEKCKHFLTLAQKAKAAKDGKPRTLESMEPFGYVDKSSGSQPLMMQMLLKKF